MQGEVSVFEAFFPIDAHRQIVLASALCDVPHRVATLFPLALRDAWALVAEGVPWRWASKVASAVGFRVSLYQGRTASANIPCGTSVALA